MTRLFGRVRAAALAARPGNPGIAAARMRASRGPAGTPALPGAAGPFRNSRNPPGRPGVQPASRAARHCAIVPPAFRNSRNSAIPESRNPATPEPPPPGVPEFPQPRSVPGRRPAPPRRARAAGLALLAAAALASGPAAAEGGSFTLCYERLKQLAALYAAQGAGVSEPVDDRAARRYVLELRIAGSVRRFACGRDGRIERLAGE